MTKPRAMCAQTNRILIVQDRREAWLNWCDRLPAMVALGAVVIAVVWITHVAKVDIVAMAVVTGFSQHLLTLDALVLAPQGLIPTRVPSFLPPGTRLQPSTKATIPYTQVESFLIEPAGAGAAIHVQTRDGRELRLSRIWCSVSADEARDALRQWHQAATAGDDHVA